MCACWVLGLGREFTYSSSKYPAKINEIKQEIQNVQNVINLSQEYPEGRNFSDRACDWKDIGLNRQINGRQ